MARFLFTRDETLKRTNTSADPHYRADHVYELGQDQCERWERREAGHVVSPDTPIGKYQSPEARAEAKQKAAKEAADKAAKDAVDANVAKHRQVKTDPSKDEAKADAAPAAALALTPSAAPVAAKK